VKGLISIFMLFAMISFGTASVLPPMPVKTCAQQCCGDEGGCPCDPTMGDCGADCCKIHNPPLPLHWQQPVFSPFAPVPGDSNDSIARAWPRTEKPPLPPPRC